MSKENLIKEEKSPLSIYVTGNTAIDALKTTVEIIIVISNLTGQEIADLL